MEENKRNEVNNLPVVQNNKGLIKKSFVNDTLKRVGKIGGYATLGTGLLFMGVASSFISVPVIAGILGTVFTIGAVAAGSKSLANVVFRNEDDLLFSSQKKLDGKVHITQKFGMRKELKNFDSVDIAGFMALNTVVGLSRFQNELMNKNKLEQEFTTRTHQINLNVFKELEKLGYIKIDDIKDKGESSLFIEKIGVGNFKSAAKAFTNKNGKTKMKQIDFKLTDKKIDIEDMYIDYISKSDKEKNSSKLGKLLFSDKYGFLSKNRNKGISFNYDKYGRLIIDYKSKESGIEKIEKDIDVLKYRYNEEKDDFALKMQEKNKSNEQVINVDLEKNNERKKEIEEEREI